MLSCFRVDGRKWFEYATCRRVCCRKRKTVLRFWKISARYEYTRPEVWPASFSASYKSTVRFLVTNREEGRRLCRKMHAKWRSVVFNLSTRCCVHLLLYLQGKSDSLQKADLLTEWWMGERVWGWIIADTELFPSEVTTVSECLVCSVLHYR